MQAHARRRAALTSIGFLVAFAGSTRAQCEYTVWSVPDLDQYRTAATGIPGLPGDGLMYCVPTAVTNWFAYFANHGIPQPTILDGPRDWQSNDNYNIVTGALDTMGDLMQTTTSNGTKGPSGLAGAIEYSETYCGGLVSVDRFYCGDGDALSPCLMWIADLFGCYVSTAYGYYTETSNDHYQRNGGHCVTVVGVSDVGSTQTITFRDPASDTTFGTTQSTYTSHTVDLTYTSADFDLDGDGTYDPDSLYRLDYGTSTPKFLDSWYILCPTIALTGILEAGPVSGFIRLLYPFQLVGSSGPPIRDFPAPPGSGPLRDMVIRPGYPGSFYYITGPLGPTPSRLYFLNAITGQSTELAAGTDFRFLVFNRFGGLYVCDGGVIKLLSLKTSPPVVVGTLTLSAPPEVIGYDDTTDTLAYVTPPSQGSRSLVRHNPMLTALGSSAPFPPSVNPTGASFLSFGPTGHIYFCGQGTGEIYRLSQTGNTLTRTQTINLPAGSQPTGLNASNADHVLYVSGGVLHEYEPGPGGLFIPAIGSVYAGLAAGPRFSLLRSRTNYIASRHGGPSWANNPNPEIPPGVPDCYANCDGSTGTPRLTGNDFTCFINAYANGQSYANCDGSTGTPLLTGNDFLCFINSYAAGCS